MRDSTISDVLAGNAQWCVVNATMETALRALPDLSIDSILTDPPYEAAAHTLQRRAKTGGVWGHGDERIAVVQPLNFEPITEAERDSAGERFSALVKRWVAVFCQVEASQRWADALTSARLHYIRTGIWVKPDAQPQLTGDRPGMGYESIVFAHPRGKKRWNGGGKSAVFEYCRDARGGGEPAWEHPTVKPLALMNELVELFTDEGEVILDCYAGSGTTGVAAIRRNRRVILIEKDPKYAQLARERCEAESRGLTLGAARSGQLSILDVI